MTASASRHCQIMVSAGEASGDIHAAHALDALRQRGLSFDSFGMGAGELASGGTELIVDCRDLSVIGFVDVLINYPKFLKRLKKLREAMTARRPDLLLLVDYPDFNLKLAETARALDIPVLFYVSPQIWAWRSGRIHAIGQRISHMAVLFPFEVPLYEKAGIPVTHVGNPLVDDTRLTLSQEAAREALGLPTDKRLVALLPGSRNGEISRILPVMLDALEKLAGTHPDVGFVLPVASTVDRELLDQLLAQSSLQIHRIDGQSHQAMRAADAVLVASGTATLETALIGTPMVVVYIVKALNYAIMRRLIRIPHVSLANIVAEREVVKEYIQHAATAGNIHAELVRLLDDADYRNKQLDGLADIQQRMGDGGASARVATLIEELISG